MSIVTPTDTIQCGDHEAERDVLYDYQCTSSASIRSRITTLHLLVLFGVTMFGVRNPAQWLLLPSLKSLLPTGCHGAVFH